MKPKVLVLSRDSWNTTNNSGNTLSNLFQNWDSDHIANLYCRDEIPNNTVCTTYFKISESLLIRKLLRKSKVAGLKHGREEAVIGVGDSTVYKDEKNEQKLYNFFRNNRWHIFLWAREILWKIVNWKSKDLKNFLTDFNPDIIYSPSYDSFYMHDLLQFVKAHTNAKVVYFHCDDLVTYRQYSLSPFYWVNRFILRQCMNRSIKLADKNYCIIDEQARVYKKIYNVDFDILYKTGNFETTLPDKQINSPLKMVYTGNIIYGRIGSIFEIAKALEKINQDSVKAKLYLYTANPMDDKTKAKLINTAAVEIMGKVPYSDVPAILANADVLVHVESFEKDQMLSTSLSFSTKLVDYFEAGRPIFAMGWKNAASIKYLKDNKIGVVANNTDELYNVLLGIVKDKENLNALGHKSWEFGKEHHNKKLVLRCFEEELKRMTAN